MDVRQAIREDAQSLADLYLELTDDPLVNVSPSRIDDIRTNNENYLFVVTVEYVVRGSCFLSFCLDPMYGDQPFAVLENVIVTSKYRDIGLGSKMLKSVERFCFDQGASKIMLMSSSQRVDSHAFFKSHNYQDGIKKGFVKYRSSINF